MKLIMNQIKILIIVALSSSFSFNVWPQASMFNTAFFKSKVATTTTTTIVANGSNSCSGDCVVAFAYTGALQNYTLPSSCSSIVVKAWGAGASSGGAGGYATSTISVTGGETLSVIVGEKGCNGYMGCTSYPNATFGGGGAVSGSTSRVTGGGRSAVRRGTTELLTAGGGGGSTNGGAGGGTTGQKGAIAGGGYGGTQTAGGAKDTCSYDGGTTAGSKFQGGSGSSSSAGGGGWYGGAGGCDYGPGGGGSSYVPAGGTTMGGTGTTPGNSSDTVRAGAGAGGATPSHGRVVIFYNCT